MGNNGDERVKLSDSDWEKLLPGTEVKLGETTLFIKPLGLEDISRVVNQIRGIVGAFKEKGITAKNYREAANIQQIAEIVLTEAPDLISELCNLDVTDVKRLPLTPAVTILNVAIDVNIESQEGLEKNLGDLAAKIGGLGRGM